MKQFSTNAKKCRSTVAKKAFDSETEVKKAKEQNLRDFQHKCVRILVETQH